MERKNNSGGFWIGVFLGAILSVVLLMLMGTDEGKRFSKRLKRKVEDQLDDLSEEINRSGGVIDKATELKEKAFVKASQKSRDIEAKVRKIKKDVENTVDQRLSEVEDQVVSDDNTDNMASRIGNKLFKRQGKS